MINGIKNLGKETEIEIGKIKAGKNNESGYPEKLDHFIVTQTQKEDGNFKLDPVMNLLPEEPKKLKISLFHDDVNQNFLNYFAQYTGYKELHCRGNGEKAIRYSDDGSTKTEMDCNPEECSAYQNNNCKPNGILKVCLKANESTGAAYYYRTSSYHSVKRIKSNLEYIKQKTGGILAGLTLELVLREERNTDGYKIYVAHVQYPGSVAQLQREALELAKVRNQLDRLASGQPVEEMGFDENNQDSEKPPWEADENNSGETPQEDSNGNPEETPEPDPDVSKQDIIDELMEHAGSESYTLGDVKKKAFDRNGTGKLKELPIEELQYLHLEFVKNQ